MDFGSQCVSQSLNLCTCSERNKLLQCTKSKKVSFFLSRLASGSRAVQADVPFVRRSWTAQSHSDDSQYNLYGKVSLLDLHVPSQLSSSSDPASALALWQETPSGRMKV